MSTNLLRLESEMTEELRSPLLPAETRSENLNRSRRRLLAGPGLIGLLCVTVACGSEPPAQATVAEDPSKAVYVAPGGWSGGDGSKERPLDLKTALSPQSPITPGGTIWLKGGVYNVSPIVSQLTGSAQAPITVRSVPGERAVLDGARATDSVLTLLGGWTVLRDFEMTNSDPQRSGPELTRPAAIAVRGNDHKILNLVIHDFGSGIQVGADAVDAEIYGNIVYNNGFERAGTRDGFGIVGQNKTGLRRIVDNVVFGQFGGGIRAYASDQGFLNDIQLEGNVLSNNGDGAFSILLGGARVAERPVINANYVYDNPGGGINVGYAAGCDTLAMKDNYFVAVKGGYALQLLNCQGTLQGNVLVGPTRGIVGQTIVTEPELVTQYPGNEFGATPTANKTFVRPNRYEPGRAHVIVYNWEGAKEVTVQLPEGLMASGTTYELRDVRNLAAPPVASGSYNGSALTVRLEGLTAAPVVGGDRAPAHTAPGFAVFLLTSRATAPSSSLFTRLLGFIGL